MWAVGERRPLNGAKMEAMSGDGRGREVRRPRAIQRPRLRPGPLRDLKEMLYRLYLEAGGGDLTLDEIHAVAERRGTNGVAGWPGRDSIHRIIRSPTLPPSQADTVAVAAALATLARWDPDDVAQRVRGLWVRAWEHADDTDAMRSAGGVQVRDTRPGWLGVHRAIKIAAAEGELPLYVPRDVDDEPQGLKEKLADAAEDRGFVLVVGKAAVGKTRSLYEAVLDLLPDWWLLRPQGADELDALVGRDLERVIIWLDDLHRLLGGSPTPAGDSAGPTRLISGSIRRLMESGRVVLVGTLQTSHYRRYTRTDASEGQETYAVEREVLALAHVVRIAEESSEAELRRAREAACQDARIRRALDISESGWIQVMAAAPEVMAAWKDADDYARALLMAAVGLTHLGVRSPLQVGLLRATAPAYCSDRERADADADWFDTALAYATTRLHEAMSLLEPVPAPNGAMGEIAGYAVTEYLLQETEAEPAGAPVPDEIWNACLQQVSDSADLTRLGESAENRREYAHAERFYRTVAATDPRAAQRLANLMSAQGRDEEALKILLPWATTPDTEMADLAARLLARTGQHEHLRARAEAGDSAAATELVNLLMSLGREREVRAHADSGNHAIAYRLADLLVQAHRSGEAIKVLRPHAFAGDWPAAEQMTDLLLTAGRVDEALVVLGEYADRGHLPAGSRLAVLLRRLGREAELRARADAGDRPAAVQLAELLIDAGRVAELTERADAGDEPAANRLAHHLRVQGQEAELRARAARGDMPAVHQLADLLADTERPDEAIALLQPYADAGNDAATFQLLNLLGRDGGE
jgi:predicted negative regulator of RcsB-dependent stress response